MVSIIQQYVMCMSTRSTAGIQLWILLTSKKSQKDFTLNFVLILITTNISIDPTVNGRKHVISENAEDDRIHDHCVPQTYTTYSHISTQMALLLTDVCKTLGELPFWNTYNAQYVEIAGIATPFSHILRSLIVASQMALLAFVLGTIIVFVVYWISGQGQERHLPPGPRKLPFIGSLLSMPGRLEWETFAKWGQEYSPWLILCTVFIWCISQSQISSMSTL